MKYYARCFWRPPDQSNWSEFPNIWEEVQGLVYACEWYQVYDIIEALYAEFAKHDQQIGDADAEQFAEEINAFFVDEGIGWQLVYGEILTRGAEAFESVVKEASSALEESKRPTAAGHIHEALQDGLGVLLDVLEAPQVERPFHPLPVLVPEQRSDVLLEAEAAGLLVAHPSPWTRLIVGERDGGALGASMSNRRRRYPAGDRSRSGSGAIVPRSRLSSASWSASIGTRPSISVVAARTSSPRLSATTACTTPCFK